MLLFKASFVRCHVRGCHQSVCFLEGTFFSGLWGMESTSVIQQKGVCFPKTNKIRQKGGVIPTEVSQKWLDQPRVINPKGNPRPSVRSISAGSAPFCGVRRKMLGNHPVGEVAPKKHIHQGSLKDTFCNHLKHGYVSTQIRGIHHLQVAMFRCIHCKDPCSFGLVLEGKPKGVVNTCGASILRQRHDRTTCSFAWG